MPAQTSSKIKDKKGATAVEFALLVTLFLVIIMGLLEFTLTFYLEHYVASAAREGVRVGIRADNYNCFDAPLSESCTSDRKVASEKAVHDYLSRIYEDVEGDVTVNVTRVPEEAPPGTLTKTLSVAVRANNFMPNLLSGLIPGFTRPVEIIYEAKGEYEAPEEP